MFCEKCGTQLPEESNFCTNCGANIESKTKTVEKIPDTQIQLKVKPTFKFVYMILPSVIVYSIIILIISSIIGGANTEAGIRVFLVCFAILLLIVGIKTVINKKQYDSYTYDFYLTKVIYKDSFLNVSEKEVKYKYIREVTMGQTFIQRFFNIGNIILYTNAETGFGNGIFIVNVENVKDVYKNIKDIINV